MTVSHWDDFFIHYHLSIFLTLLSPLKPTTTAKRQKEPHPKLVLQTRKAKFFFIMNKQDFDLHHYFAGLQQEKQLVFFFKSRLEMRVSNEVYDSTFICTWNLPPLVFILHHYGNGPIVSGVETSSALFKTCFWKSFGYLQCLESL